MWFDQRRELIGSHLRITFEQGDIQRGNNLLELCWQRLTQFQEKYSRFIEGNTLSQLNSSTNQWQTVDSETFYLIEKCLGLQNKYQLNFSLAVKKSLENFGYDSDYSFTELSTKVIPQERRIELKYPDQLYISDPIEFGGFGKGHALDLCLQILQHETQNLCLDFGGDLYAKGLNQNAKPWKIALESPFIENEAIGSITLNDNFLTASSPMRRRWGKDNKIHHLIDVKNQRPADYWAGSFVMAKTGFEADMLATGIFCTSPEDLQKSQALQSCSFMLVNKKGQIISNNFTADLF